VSRDFRGRSFPALLRAREGRRDVAPFLGLWVLGPSYPAARGRVEASQAGLP